jgi:hypothetical protein
LAVTSSKSSAPPLRAFLQRHIQLRAFFGASLIGLGSSPRTYTFNMEFHIPFYVLRRSSGKKKTDPRGLRTGRLLPLARNQIEEWDFYYEAQLSLLVYGIDEWVWTSYCCVDTYFETMVECGNYLEGPDPVEPATGGSSRLQFPVWNPREYFLLVLSRRIMQATKEWKALIEESEERMNHYVSHSTESKNKMLIHCTCRKKKHCLIFSMMKSSLVPKN